MSQKKEGVWIFTLAFLQFFQILDFVIMMPLAPVFIRDFSINSKDFGVLVSAYNFAAAPSALIIGMLIDRFSRKNFNSFSMVGFILGTILCGLSQGYHQFLYARIFTGVFAGMLSVSVLSILGTLIPEQRRGKATGLVMSAFSFASVIGVPIGLVLAQKFGWRYVFLGLGACTLFPFILTQIVFPKMDEHLTKKAKRISLFNYIEVLKHPHHFRGVAVVGLVTLSSFLMIPFLSNLFVKNFHISELQLSLVYLFGGLGTIASSWVIGILCDRWGNAETFFRVAPISFIPMLLLSHVQTNSLVLTLLISTFFMTFVAGRFVPCVSLATQIPKDEYRGIYMSVVNSFRSFSTAVATFFGGVLLIENSNGAYENFNHLVYISIALVCLVLFLVKDFFKKKA